MIWLLFWRGTQVCEFNFFLYFPTNFQPYKQIHRFQDSFDTHISIQNFHKKKLHQRNARAPRLESRCPFPLAFCSDTYVFPQDCFWTSPSSIFMCGRHSLVNFHELRLYVWCWLIYLKCCYYCHNFEANNDDNNFCVKYNSRFKSKVQIYSIAYEYVRYQHIYYNIWTNQISSLSGFVLVLMSVSWWRDKFV